MAKFSLTPEMKKALADGVPLNEPQGNISVLSEGGPRKKRLKLLEIDITDMKEPIGLTKELESRLVGVKDIVKAENLLYIDRKTGEEVLYVKAPQKGKKPTAEQMIQALNCVTWYNGLAEHVLEWRDLKPDKSGNIRCPARIDSWVRDQLEVLWMIAVELFGSCGTSPRSGWIEDVEGFREWCLDITKIWRGSEEYDGPQEYRA